MSDPRTTPGFESQHLDRKSLRKVTGSTADFSELAQHCVCFANASGGMLLIGIEDDGDGQTESMSAAEVTEELELSDASALRPWLGRLLTWPRPAVGPHEGHALLRAASAPA